MQDPSAVIEPQLFKRLRGVAARRFGSIGSREGLRGGLAGGAFALVFGCATSAISSSGDINIAIAQIALGTLLAFIFIISINNSIWVRVFYFAGVLFAFSLIGLFVYNQALIKQDEDQQRADRQVNLAADLKEVRNRFRETANELLEQKAWRKAQERKQRLSENPAPLLPAGDYSLKGACHGDSFVNVILGSTTYGSAAFPYTAVEIKGKPAILVDAGPDGYPLVSFDIHNRDGKLMVRVTRNEVFVPPQFATMVPRKDLHNIDVLDTSGNKIFSAYFANEKTIRFTGVFYEDGVAFSLDTTSVFGGVFVTGGGSCGSHVGLRLG